MNTPSGFADRPVGMQDGYPDFAHRRRTLENQLLNFFEQEGCEMVSSGAFEYVDTLLRARPVNEAYDWIQLFDGSGRAIALRPDMTPSIARMAAPLLATSKGPLFWCYAERVFRRSDDPASLSWAGGKAAESTQLGVEWLGVSGTSADANLIHLCLQALHSISVTGEQVVVSHASFTECFLLDMGLPKVRIHALLNMLVHGDYVGFQHELESEGVYQDVLRSLQTLSPYEPGSLTLVETKFLEAGHFSESTKAAWLELTKLADELVALGLREDVTFDLTLQRDIRYYTGLVFEVFAPGVGAPIALGGRYDMLLGQFGCNADAVGFTFEVERVLGVLNELGRDAL